MNSITPYIFKAVYEWFNDNELTPLLIVNPQDPDLSLPASVIGEGNELISLLISKNAIVDLEVSNDSLEFKTRFSGVSTEVVVPFTAIIDIRCREDSDISFPLFIFLPNKQIVDADDESIFKNKEEDEGEEPMFSLVEKDK